jgi:uncharacterized protein YjbJ (UPF0337 family)
MNLDQLEGKFKEVKGTFLQKYAQHISEDDLQYSEGKFEEMLGKIQTKIGKSKEELQEEISNL